MAQTTGLELLGETELEAKTPAGGRFPVGCPTLDLAATWDQEDRNLLVYRPPNQIVSKIHQAASPGERAPEFLSLGWSDGVVRLMGLENNKAAHHIPVCDKAEAAITHIGWSTAIIASKTDSAISTRLGDEVTRGWTEPGGKIPLDLPQELTFLEVETALPKISPLPTSSAGAGEDATVFTLRSGIEFLFRTPKRDTYDQVNVMIVGTSEGKLHLSIYDSFTIGTFPQPSLDSSALASASEPSSTARMIHHASHPRVSTHALIYAEKQNEPQELHLIPMDLPFLSFSPINLSLLSSKLTTLQALLRYLKQISLHMQVEWKNARELPARFLRSVQGDLEEMHSGPRGIVSALFHTAITGHAYPPVKEWLVDSLAERGHKRWDKAVMSGLEGLRSLVHQHFLPALERCSIILSRLRGLARFYKDREDIGLSIPHLNRVLDIVSCLTLVGHKVLIHTMDELQHFSAFSAWLRFQIDQLGGPSTANEELTDKEAMMDHSKVLTYIEHYLTNSPLDIFLDEIAKEDYSSDWNFIEDGPTLLDVLDKQLKKHEAGQPSMKALPHVDFLVNYATTWSNRIFSSIAEAKRRSVRFGKPVKLSIGKPIAKMDMKMCSSDKKNGAIFVALAPQQDVSRVYLFRMNMTITNGISDNQPVTTCVVDLAPRSLVDMKFLNDKTLILFCSDPGISSSLFPSFSVETLTSTPVHFADTLHQIDNTPIILAVPTQDESKLSYSPYDVANPDQAPSLTSAELFPKYDLPASHHALRPIRMEVHDRSDVRGEVPARICLLGSNRTTWRTYKTPF
ncbi:anaphase-promoting complex component cut20 apc4 [Trichoderma arundinaceum]|uniref:Anaphase-promoting complex subunit 4 n=1 Tax=Trichoderma arundinaceum TaxID=490622 RepID=A0A395NFU9_TRIAR|nr:anaphase-promoting complex component cut20 apc4 [Trichoderma arundinaceum]